MKIGDKPYRTVWRLEGREAVAVIDQTKLPFLFEIKELTALDEVADAISTMIVRGAPLIGVTAAYGVAMAMSADSSDAALDAAYDVLFHTRPTAVNLRWALDEMRHALQPLTPNLRAAAAWERAAAMAEEDVAISQRIGEAGLPLIEETYARVGRRVNILTHCNAGWLATIDWGTATAPIYMAHDRGIPVHVFVDETRPRNQGSSLTAFELSQHGVPHTVIADNAGGHLMQHGQIDLCIVGTDRTTARGDVCNKIGTYLKALAAQHNGVPFYVALPHTTIDWTIDDGLREIPIEERNAREVTHIQGRTAEGLVTTVEIVSPGSPAANPAFDVTPAELVTALVTDRGVCPATREGLESLFPEGAPGT